MAQRVYLTVAEVLAIHHRQIETCGGSHGLRDVGALEAAVFWPQNGYYNGLAEEAAALMESLANNHPFIDGNKRIAFAATDTFLARNGFFLDVEPLDTYRFIMGSLEKSTFRFASIVDWHALTTDYADTSRLKESSVEVLLDWLAAGLDPEKCVMFIQSHVPAHAELHLLLSMITPLGWLERVPTYKEQKENIK